MNVKAALKGQYHAALAMLREGIVQCPEELWVKGAEPVAFWRVAYHTLFFTHMYLCENVKAFRSWEKAREDYQYLGKMPWPPYREPVIGEPYTKEEILEYWKICDAMVDGAVDEMDLERKECGFWWYKLPKLDHQLVNIRHIQHHAALLAGRLRVAGAKGVGWVGGKM